MWTNTSCFLYWLDLSEIKDIDLVFSLLTDILELVRL